MSYKVLVSVFSNLYTDQRVEKVCKTLHENHYNVELVGNNWGGAPEMSRPYFFKRIGLKSKKLRFAYLEFQIKLYQELQKKADQKTILLANDLDTLLPNYLISKRKKIPLVWDSHEIFTEMPSVNGRWVQKVWRLLEKNIVPKLNLVMTANQSYANWFVKKYNIKMPVVVRNFPEKISEIEHQECSPKIILYQGAINFSRGIDKMILAMKHIQNAEFHIAGEGPMLEEYQNLVKKEKLESTIKFLGKMAPKDLREITKKASVGLSIEENNGVSYYYSLPNKISDYIQSRVPVVVSDFPEMKNIVETYKTGEIITHHSAEELSQKINAVLEKGKEFYLENLNVAAQDLCWEKEAPKLLRLFEEAKTDKI